MTGRYPGYAGVRDILMAHRDTPGLAPDVPTLADDRVLELAGPLQVIENPPDVLVYHLDHRVVGRLELLTAVLFGAARRRLKIYAGCG
jgi:hypothetical protein